MTLTSFLLFSIKSNFVVRVSQRSDVSSYLPIMFTAKIHPTRVSPVERMNSYPIPFGIIRICTRDDKLLWARVAATDITHNFLSHMTYLTFRPLRATEPAS